MAHVDAFFPVPVTVSSRGLSLSVFVATATVHGEHPKV